MVVAIIFIYATSEEIVENTSKSDFTKSEVISPNSPKIPSQHAKVRFKEDANTYVSVSNTSDKPMTKIRGRQQSEHQE